MADSTLDFQKKDAFARRVNSVPGANVAHWNTKQKAEWYDVIMSAPEEMFRAPAQPRKFVDPERDISAVRTKLMASSMLAKGDGQLSGNTPWIFCITGPVVDLQNDLVPAGAAQFDPKNFPILLSHQSENLPIARSSAPWVVNGLTLAIANFPALGISPLSDQVAAMVRAGQVKGASIGFIPIRYTLSKDPARPFGVDFQEIRVIEWSICSIPCCPAALAIGPASNKSANIAPAQSPAPRSTAVEPATREQRIAEAARFRRAAYRA